MSVMERLRYRGPKLDPGDGLVVEPFTVEEHSLGNLRLMFQPGNRATAPGTYTRLDLDGVLWMSDTDAERRDHITPVLEADRFFWRRSHDIGMSALPDDRRFGRGLVNGLGLGLVVAAMLDVLDHVDVVERDTRVVEHIGGWYQSEYGPRVTIHHDDAYTIKWPVGTRWDVAWHDIWPNICEDNLESMATLHRRYGRRVGWQGSWCQHELRAMRRRSRESPWR